MTPDDPDDLTAALTDTAIKHLLSGEWRAYALATVRALDGDWDWRHELGATSEDIVIVCHGRARPNP